MCVVEQIWVPTSRKWVRLHQLRIAAFCDVEILKKILFVMLMVFLFVCFFLPSCLWLLEAAVARTHKEEGQ